MNPVSAEIWENKEIVTAIYRLKLRPYAPVRHVDPGRFFMIRVGRSYDPLLRRPLSHLGVSTTEGGVLITEFLYEVRGRGTEYLSRQSPPRVISLLGPLGRGWRLEETPTEIVMTAGGMGVVPLFAAARVLSLRRPPPRITFIFGARKRRGLVLTDELRSMVSELRLFTEDGSEGQTGRAAEGLAQLLKGCGGKKPLVLACGPRPMLQAVAVLARRHKVTCQVSLEARMACGMGACQTCVVPGTDGKNLRVCREGPVFDVGEVDWEALDDFA